MKCAECNGRKKINGETCSHCNGTGSEPCGRCGGSGLDPNANNIAKCKRCKGKGTVEEQDE